MRILLPALTSTLVPGRIPSCHLATHPPIGVGEVYLCPFFTHPCLLRSTPRPTPCITFPTGATALPSTPNWLGLCPMTPTIPSAKTLLPSLFTSLSLTCPLSPGSSITSAGSSFLTRTQNRPSVSPSGLRACGLDHLAPACVVLTASLDPERLTGKTVSSSPRCPVSSWALTQHSSIRERGE